MSRTQAAGLFFLAWLLFLVLLAPMRWLGEPKAWRDAGLSATGASGTVWNGRWRGVAAGPRRIGDVHASVSAAPLMTGTLAITLAADDAGGQLLLGRERGLRAASGAWPLILPAADGALPLALSLDGVSVVFQGGRCVEAAGKVDATITLPTAARLALSGVPACREGVAELNLLPEAGSPTIELLVQAKADGHYRMTWTARNPDPSQRRLLALAGFTAGINGLVRVDEGTLAAAMTAQE